MGNLATSSRLKMVETTVIPAILYGVEAFPSLSKSEQELLEKMQGKLLKDLMELPQSTPYEALLLELGMPTMEARVNYRKLMVYQNIRSSDDRRIIKKVLEEQQKMDREGTWVNGLKNILDKYKIKDTTDEDLKSTWKSKVKSRIAEVTEKEIRERCGQKSKARTALKGEYNLKGYLKETSITQATQILRARLHMTKLPCNYKQDTKDEGCPLCGAQSIRTEHYFHCDQTKALRKAWNTSQDDLISESTADLIKAASFLEAVSLKIQPQWKDAAYGGKKPKTAAVCTPSLTPTHNYILNT